MLDHRLVRDDGRGLGQEVMDNRPMNVVFHILVESNISTTLCLVSNPFPLSPSLLSHHVGAHLKKKNIYIYIYIYIFETALSHDSHLGSCLVDTKVSSHTIKKRKNCSIRS